MVSSNQEIHGTSTAADSSGGIRAARGPRTAGGGPARGTSGRAAVRRHHVRIGVPDLPGAADRRETDRAVVRRRSRGVVAVPRLLSDHVVRGLRLCVRLDRARGPAWQLAIHAAVVAAAALALPVLPGDAWKPDGSGDPSAQILAMLGANVALPFLALAATGPLVALWFSRRYPGRSPYPLYAVSNLGSLIALLAYPFALEPRLPLSATGRLWSRAFVATGVAVVACAALAWHSGAPAAAEPRGRRRRRAAARADRALGPAGGLRGGDADGRHQSPVSRPRERPVPVDRAALDLSRHADRLLRGAARCIADPVRAVRCWPIRDRLAPLFRVGIAAGRLRSAACCNSRSRATECCCSRPAWCCTASSIACARPRARSPPTTSALRAAARSAGSPSAWSRRACSTVSTSSPLGLAVACCSRSPRVATIRRGGSRRADVALGVAAALACPAIGYQGREIARDRSPDLLHQERSFFGVLRVESAREPPYRALLHGTTMHGMQVEGPRTRPPPTTAFTRASGSRSVR